jgi:hypothetical protein
MQSQESELRIGARLALIDQRLDLSGRTNDINGVRAGSLVALIDRSNLFSLLGCVVFENHQVFFFPLNPCEKRCRGLFLPGSFRQGTGQCS